MNTLRVALEQLLVAVEAGTFGATPEDDNELCSAAHRALYADAQDQVAQLQERERDMYKRPATMPAALTMALGEIDGAPSEIGCALKESHAMGVVQGLLCAQAIDAFTAMDYGAAVGRRADARRNVLRGLRHAAGVRAA